MAALHGVDRADLDAGAVHVADDPRDPPMLRRIAIGAHEQFLPIGDRRETGPQLLTIDDQMVAIDDRAGLQGREIGPGLGLGETLAPHHFTAQDLGEVEVLVLLAGPTDQRGAGVAVADEARVDTGKAQLGVLLIPDDLLQQREAPTPVLHRPIDAGPAAFPLLALPRQVELTRRLAVARPWLRWPVLVDPRANFFSEGRIAGGNIKIHIDLLHATAEDPAGACARP